MYRMGTPDRNDTPLIIGNLPKRLQEKIITRGSQNNGNDHGQGQGPDSVGQRSDSTAIISKRSSSTLSDHFEPEAQPSRDADFKAVNTENAESPSSLLLNTINVQRKEDLSGQGLDDYRSDNQVIAIDYFLRSSSSAPKASCKKPLQQKQQKQGSDGNGGNRLLTVLNNANRAANNATTISAKSNGGKTMINSVVIPGILRLNLDEIHLLNQKECRRTNGNRQYYLHQNQQQQHNNANMAHNKIQLSPLRQFPSTNKGCAMTLNWVSYLPEARGKQFSNLYEAFVKMISQHHVLKVNVIPAFVFIIAIHRIFLSFVMQSYWSILYLNKSIMKINTKFDLFVVGLV